MRTKSGEKEKLRLEILKDSVQTFKKFGLTGAPVDQIMKKAGLTSGALYSHFKGKDDLFIEAALFDLDHFIDRYRKVVAENGVSGLRKIISDYFHIKHVTHPEIGCLYAALSPDIHRSKSKKKDLFASRYDALMNVFTLGISGKNQADKRNKATLLFSIMLGSLSTARMIYPSKMTEQVLNIGREQVLSFLEK